MSIILLNCITLDNWKILTTIFFQNFDIYISNFNKFSNITDQSCTIKLHKKYLKIAEIKISVAQLKLKASLQEAWHGDSDADPQRDWRQDCSAVASIKVSSFICNMYINSSNVLQAQNT